VQQTVDTHSMSVEILSIPPTLWA